MTNPGNKREQAPRCYHCGRYMSVSIEKERLIVYECCSVEKVKFKPEFKQPREQLWK